MEISTVKEIAPLGYYTPATGPRSPAVSFGEAAFPPMRAAHLVTGFDSEPRWLFGLFRANSPAIFCHQSKGRNDSHQVHKRAVEGQSRV